MKLGDRYSVIWILGAPILCLTWAIMFWGVFFVFLSWEILKIPMGEGGAVYPGLFWSYVLGGAMAWELCVAAHCRARSCSRIWAFCISIMIPCILTSLALIMFCPMDVQQSYLSYLLSNIL